MKRFCFSIFWVIVALLLTAFLRGVLTFCMSFVGLDPSRDVPIWTWWVIAIVLAGCAVGLSIQGAFPGTDKGSGD